MSVFLPIDKFFERSGNSAAEFTESLRDEVATFACELWQSYPGWLTKIPTPSASFTRGFMNSMCSPIQPPVTAPENPSFSGGQCSGVTYIVSVYYYNINPSNCSFYEEVRDFEVIGAVTGLSWEKREGSDLVTQCDPANPDLDAFIAEWYIETENGRIEPAVINTVYNPDAPQRTSNAYIQSVTRKDGLPDDCGDAPKKYPPRTPQPSDLVKNTFITVNDNLNLDLEIQMITNNNLYNFPLNFRVNGVNVTLDIGGIHIHGNPQITSPDKLHNIDPPGAAPTFDPLGNEINITFNNEYLVAPDNPNDGTIEETIEQFICTDGVLEIIDVVIEVVAGNYPMLLLILQTINAILKDICDMEDAEGVTIALPEWYGLRPGVDRPCVCLIWKTYSGDTWGKSSYSTTITHPTQSFINSIKSMTSISKTMGKNMLTLILSDGSKLKTSGITKSDARDNLDYMIARTRSEFLPQNYQDKMVQTYKELLQEKTVYLRQVEYYPAGQSGNVSPIIRHIIDKA